MAGQNRAERYWNLDVIEKIGRSRSKKLVTENRPIAGRVGVWLELTASLSGSKRSPIDVPDDDCHNTRRSV